MDCSGDCGNDVKVIMTLFDQYTGSCDTQVRQPGFHRLRPSLTSSFGASFVLASNIHKFSSQEQYYAKSQKQMTCT